MTSLPDRLVNMPRLERTSTDSSPSSAGGSACAMSTFDHFTPGTIYPPFFQQMQYQQMSIPTAIPPSSVFGYGQQMPGLGGLSIQPDFASSYQAQAFNEYTYGSSAPLPTMPPRYSTSGPMNIPGRATCVSPLDLFGGFPSQLSLPTHTYLANHGVSLGAYREQAMEVAVDVEEAEGPGEVDVISPATSTDSLASVDEEVPVKVEKKVTKTKKIRPAGPVELPAGLSSPTKAKTIKAGAAVEPEKKEGKKRSRTSQACERCRIRKARCFGGNPCNRCIKRKFVCEFTPTRPRPVIAKPEPTPKPTKARRHSMHTVPSASSSALPTHHHSLSQTHSLHATTQLLPHTMTLLSYAMPSVFTQPIGAIRPSVRHVPTMPLLSETSLPPPNASQVGLGLGLHLGIELTPPPDEDEVDIDSDMDMPGMSHSFSGSSASASGSGSGLTSVSGNHLTASNAYTPLIMGEDEIFTFSPIEQSSSFMEWGVSDSSHGLSGFNSTAEFGDISHLSGFGGQYGFGSDEITQGLFVQADDWASGGMRA